MASRNRLKIYYRLTKPGIVYGNAITAIAGFLLASKGSVDLGLLAATVGGLSLVVASACVFNNYIDRGLDQRMDRTKKRALAVGSLRPKVAIAYATTLGVAGFALLAIFTNWLSFFIALTAFIFYVVFYGIAKRRSVHGTLVGSLPGAAPPVIGYCAVTGQLDGGALLLFLIMVFWQMPHFYAIAMYRFADYKAAGLPVLPVKRGFAETKIQILLYISAFIVALCGLTIFGYTGYAYLVVAGLVGLAWLALGIKGYRAINDKLWARQMFLFSLLVTLVVSVMISANSLLVKL